MFINVLIDDCFNQFSRHHKNMKIEGARFKISALNDMTFVIVNRFIDGV